MSSGHRGMSFFPASGPPCPKCKNTAYMQGRCANCGEPKPKKEAADIPSNS